MSSRQSPLPPPPQSPLIHLGMDRLKLQLELEERLRMASEELLEVYKNSRQWKQVTQMAQTLGFNAERITCIQDCIESLDSTGSTSSTVFVLPPPAAAADDPLSSTTVSELPKSSTMVEDPYDEFISVKPAEQDKRDSMGMPYWEIKSKKHTRGEPVFRTSNDVSLLLSNVFKGGNSKFDVDSSDAIRDIITACLDDLPTNDKDLLLLQSFLAPSINNFSSLLLDSETLAKPQVDTVIEEEEENEQQLPSQSLDESTDGTELSSQSQVSIKLTDTSTAAQDDSLGQPDSHNEDPQSDTDHLCTQHGDDPTSPNAVLPEHENKDSLDSSTTDDVDTSHIEIEDEPETTPDNIETPTEHKLINKQNIELSTEDTVSEVEPSTEHVPEVEPSTEDTVPEVEPTTEDSEEVKEIELSTENSVPEVEPTTEHVPEVEPSSEDSEAVPEAEPSPKDSETVPIVEPISVPEVEPSTKDNDTVPEAEPSTEDNVPEVEPSTENSETVPVVEPSTEDSVPEVEPSTKNNDTVPEAEPSTEDSVPVKPNTEDSVPEVEPNTEDSETVPEVEPSTEDNVPEVAELQTSSVTMSDTPSTESIEDVRPKQSPSKHGIKITNASQMFIQFQSINEIDDSSEPSETPPLPLCSDTDDVTDTPTDNMTDTPTDLTSSDIFSRSGEISEDIDSDKRTTDEKPSNSTFFVDSKSQNNPRLRNKSHSVFYPRSSPSPPPDQADKAKFKTRLKRSFKRSNKIKREVSMIEEPQVSLMAPQLATEWDPTCILEELYSDCRPVAPQSSEGEDNGRYAGYLDKLPVNQSKPAVMKGWKHRYFRVTRGSLFYYEDSKNPKAISFVRLTDAKITLHIESLKVEIVEKNGNFIFLRAETKKDAIAFHRALQLECVHPTLTHRLSLSPSRTTPTIIIDLGSCSVRAGLISDDNDYPQLFFPNVCAISNDKVIACGHDSLLPTIRGSSKLVYPRRHRSRMDSTVSIRECFTAIVEYICKKLDVKPESCNMLASVSPIMPEMEQQILAEVVLEMLGFQGLLIQEQTTLALYSYNCTTGISVSVGDTISVVPIIDGYKVEGADQHIPLGGINISENLSKLASSKDIRYFSDTEMYIIRHVKESLCFVSQDYFQDSDKCDEAPHEYMRAIDVDRFQLPDHKKVIALDLSLFKAPEGLFQPGIWGKDVSGIHEMVHRSIEQCPIDLKRDMCRYIYLSGGTTLMTGFPERLKSELSKLLPRIEIIVNADESRYHAAYLGACILASLNTFQKSLVTQDDWISEGFDAFKKSSN